MENKINTGWLDQRIAANVRAEKPPWELCVIGAAAVRAHEAFACKAAEYLAFLGKGQLPPADISLIFFQVGAAASARRRHHEHVCSVGLLHVKHSTNPQSLM